MSSIDERVVQMQFQNSEFEKGIKETLKSLDSLKESLKLDEAAEGLRKLQEIGDSFSLAHISNGIDNLSERFSAFGTFANRIIENLADTIYHKLGSALKDVTVGQIGSGWNKYAEDTKAVQTIMFATGDTIENVEAELEKLTWFTDETSYNYTDMVSNIGKFTSMKIPLSDARIAMQGIALAAAAAGQGASEASRAMYNVSQAMGAGYMKLMDWKSIENANMATADLKQNAINAAIALGKLDSQGRLFNKDKTLVTIDNFSETLKDGWFTKDVVMKVFGDYGEFAEKVQKLVEETGMDTSDAIEQLSGTTSMFSENAFRAGQEAKTFGEALDALKDATSTKWLNIFKLIFGNYEQAKVLWTKLANDLYDIFVTPLDDFIDVLRDWHASDELGNWKDFMQGINDIMDGLKGILITVRDSFSNLIPPVTVERLQNFGKIVKDFGSSFKAMFGIPEEEEDAAEVVEETEKVVDSASKKVTKNFGVMESITKKISDNLAGLKTNLSKGMRGDEVKVLQEQLNELNVTSEKLSVDGIFGPKTLAAVKALQKQLGISETGVLDDATKAALKTDEAVQKLQETASKGIGLGDRGKEVKDLQRELNKYLDDSEKLVVDGIFGPKTEAAVKKMQETLGEKQTGVWNKASKAALEGSRATLVSLNKINKAMRSGKRGDDVKTLQTQLNRYLGINDQIVADGIYGPKTEAAVKKMQEALGVEQTGVWDKATIIALRRAQRIENANKKASEAAEKIAESGEESAKALAGGAEETKAYGNALDRIQSIFGGVAAVGGILVKVLGGLWTVTGAVIDTLSPLGNVLLTIAGGIGDALISFNEWLGSSGVIDTWAKSISNSLKPVKEWISSISDSILIFLELKAPIDGTNEGLITLSGVWKKVISAIDNSGVVKTLSDAFTGLKNKIVSFAGVVIGKIPSAVEALKSLWASLSLKGKDALSKIPGVLNSIKRALTNSYEFLFGNQDLKSGRIGVFTRFGKLLSGDISGFVSGLKTETAEKVVNVLGTISYFIAAIRDKFSNLIKGISAFFTGRYDGRTVLSKAEVAALDFRKRLEGYFDALKSGFGKAFETVKTFFSGKGNLSVLKDSTIKKILNIRKKISAFVSGVAMFFTGNKDGKILLTDAEMTALNLRKKLEGYFESVKEFVSKIGPFVQLLFTGKTDSELLDGRTVDKVLRFRENLTKTLTAIANGIKYAFNRIKDVFAGGFNFDKLKQLIADAFTGLGNVLKSMWDGANKAVRWAIGLYILYKVANILDNVTGILDKVKSIFQKDNDKVASLSWSILRFAISLGLIVGSILLLGVPDTNKLMDGVLVVGIIGAALARLVYLAKKNISADEAESIKKLGSAITGFSTSIAILIASIEILGYFLGRTKTVTENGEEVTHLVGLENFLIGLAGLTAILGVLGAFIWALNKLNATELNINGDSLWQLSVVIGALTAVVLILGDSKLAFEDALKGLFAATVLLAGLGGMLTLVGKYGGGEIEIKGLIGLSVALVAMAHVAKSMAKLKTGDYLKAIGTIVVAMGSIIGLFAVLGHYGDKLKVGTILSLFGGLAVIAVVFALVLRQVRDIDPLTMVAFAGSLAIAIGAMVGLIAACAYIGKTNESTKGVLKGAAALAGSLIIISSALAIIVGGLGMLTKIKALSGAFARGSKVLQIIADGFAVFKDGGFNHFGTLMIGLLAISAVMSKFDKNYEIIRGSLDLAGSMIILSAALAIIVGGIGYLAEQEWASGMFESGSRALEEIAKAVTVFKDNGFNHFGTIMSVLLVISAVMGAFGGAVGSAVVVGSLYLAAALVILVLALTIIVGGLGYIDEAWNGGLSGAIEKGGDVLASISGAIKKFLGGFKDDLIGNMEAFSGAMSELMTTVDGISGNQDLDADVQKAIDIASKMKEFFEGIGAYGINLSGIEGYNSAAEQLSNDIRTFGTNISEFRLGVKDLDSDNTIESDTDEAIRLAKKIKEEFFDVIGNDETLPSGSGLATYNNRLSSIIGNVDAFGTSMGLYHNGVSGFNTLGIQSDTQAAIEAAREVARFLEELGGMDIETKKQGVIGWFQGDTKQDTVSEYVVKLSESITSSKDKLKDLGSSGIAMDTASAVAAFTQVANFLNFLSDENLNVTPYQMTYGGAWLDKVDVFTTNFDSLATYIQEFSAKMQGVDINGVASVISSVTGFFEMLSGGLSGSYDRFIEKINSDGFGGELGQVVSNMALSLESHKEQFKNAGINFDLGLAEGVTDQSDSPVNAAGLVAKAMLQKVAEVLDENSPSEETRQQGRYFTQGLTEGVSEEGKEPVNAVAGMVGAMLSKASEFVSSESGSNLATGILSKFGVDEKVAESSINAFGAIADAFGKAEESGDALGSALGVIGDQIGLSNEQTELFSSVVNGAIESGDAFGGIMDAVGSKLGLSEEQADSFKDAAGRMIEAFKEGNESGDAFGSVLGVLGSEIGLSSEKLNAFKDVAGGAIDGLIEGKEHGDAFGISVGKIGDFLGISEEKMQSYMGAFKKIKNSDSFSISDAFGFGEAEDNASSFFSSLTAEAETFKSNYNFGELFSTALSKGSKGQSVKEMQAALMSLGYNLDKFGADGIFGPETQAALNEFKKDAGLAVNGVFDTDAYDKLKSALTGEEAISAYKKAGETVITTFTDAISSGDTKPMKEFIDSILKTVTDKTKDFKMAGENFANGLVNGVYFKTYSAVEAASYVARQMVAAVKNVFQTASPSKVTTLIGKYFSQGLAVGVEKEGATAVRSSKEVSESMIRATEDTLKPISEILTAGLDDLSPVIRPVVDTSEVEAAKEAMSDWVADYLVRRNRDSGDGQAVTNKMVDGVSSEISAAKKGGYFPGPYGSAKVWANVSDLISDANKQRGSEVDEFKKFVGEMSGKFGDMTEAVTNMKLVLDTGEFVGSTARSYDKQFGRFASRRERGN